MSAKTLYYFAVGGTGALSVEPLLHLCAAGLGPERLVVLLIDPDTSNPAISRAMQLLDGYKAAREAAGNPGAGFFRTALIRSADHDAVWSPIGTDGQGGIGSLSLEDFVQKPLMGGDVEIAKDALDLLFSPEQQKEQLREGFRGNPAIGSVLMHNLRNSRLFKDLLNSALNDTDSRFFATGSIFGGTGASALPVIARILEAKGVTPSRMGAAVLTPYYALKEPGDAEERDGRLKPDSGRFLQATKAALPTYANGRSDYGTMYVIGDDQSIANMRATRSAGGNSQRNNPHFAELFAAMAAIDFAQMRNPGDGVHLKYATLDGTEPGWNDLILERREELTSFVIASNFFLQYFGETRNTVTEQRLATEMQMLPWVSVIGLQPTFVRTSAAELNALGEYFASFWGWLWAVTNNYEPLRLVSFENATAIKVNIPGTYVGTGSTFNLPSVDSCLLGYNVRAKKGWFKKGDAGRFGQLSEMFKWWDRAAVKSAPGVPGFVKLMHDGTEKFVEEWYSSAN